MFRFDTHAAILDDEGALGGGLFKVDTDLGDAFGGCVLDGIQDQVF